MSKYDFQKKLNRLDSHSEKWKEVEKEPDVLPLWVADMDFEILPEIKAAVQAYAAESVYGYTYVADSLYQAILDWEWEQHGYRFDKSALLLVEGVVPGLGLAVQSLTNEGDSVLINTPVYPPFARTVKLNDRKLVTNSLIEVDGKFRIDFEKLEQDIIENQVKMYLLCSPHNPGGRVWSLDELRQVGELCAKHGVILVSDEIHQDLVLFGNEQHTINSVSETFKDFTVVLSSATKTFNIAGTKCSYAIIENPELRKKYLHKRLANNQHEIATIGSVATEAAYRNGAEWLSELKGVLEGNVKTLTSELESKTKIKVMAPEGTYLVWLDFSAYDFADDDALFDKIRHEAKLILNRGDSFGVEGKRHARFNVAAPSELIEKALARLVETFGDEK